MKTRNKVLVTILAVAVVIGIFREPIKLFVYGIVTSDMFVTQDDDNFDPGPQIGEAMPPLRALYNGEEIRSLEAFSGVTGKVLIASRSFDWCPYCMRQMIELQQHKTAFEQAGLALVAMTYDTPELQRAFADKHAIDIPILADINAASFESLGILNAEYQKGDDRFGLPYPGIIIINKQGIVVGKLFIEAYSSRVDARSSLDYAIYSLRQQQQ